MPLMSVKFGARVERVSRRLQMRRHENMLERKQYRHLSD